VSGRLPAWLAHLLERWLLRWRFRRRMRELRKKDPFIYP
jgi:hypothetical protein